MCSISGVLTISRKHETFERSKSVAVSTVRTMNGALKHRGPDDEGLVEIAVSPTSTVELSLVLGNTRLAILDRSSAGHQPMRDRQSGMWLTYNGETYNYRILREEIGDEFGAWESTSDTEVVLRAYQKWGEQSLGKFRGMFALALWDEDLKQLVLARDRFGIKPLYYTVVKGSDATHLIFASEVRALLATGLASGTLNEEGVASFLSCGSIQSPLTIIDGITSLKPGEKLTVAVRAGEFVFESETLSEVDALPSPANRKDAVAILRNELAQAVRVHLESDVPLGVFLSGGMDSSALVALASAVSTEPLRTFSIVFDEKSFSESSHARFIADKFQTNHLEIPITEEDLLNELPCALASFDQPTIDGVNSYVISKAVKQAGITVALSGLGGDELFAGYPSFSRAIKANSISPLTRSLARAAASLGNFALKRSVRGRKLSQFVESDMTPTDVYTISRQLFSRSEAEVISRTKLPVLNGDGHSNESEGKTSVDLINDISRLEMAGYMANTLLRDTDSTSMASSLEVRVPFVDAHLVDYVLRLPGEWKVDSSRPGLPKPLLADAISDLLPESFLTRPKMGFTFPFEKWMLGRLQREVGSVLCGKNAVESSGLNYRSTESLWRRFLASPSSVGWTRPWALYALAKWCELNKVRAAN